MSEQTISIQPPRSFFMRNPSVLVFLLVLSVLTIGATLLSEAFGMDVLSTSFIKTLGNGIGFGISPQMPLADMCRIVTPILQQFSDRDLTAR